MKRTKKIQKRFPLFGKIFWACVALLMLWSVTSYGQGAAPASPHRWRILNDSTLVLINRNASVDTFFMVTDSLGISYIQGGENGTVAFLDVLKILDFLLYTGGANFAAYDTTDAPVDGDQLTWGTGNVLDWQPASAGGGEANTLSDSGIYNNSEGFGLAAGKTGVALKVKGLIEGSNITITKSADSALIIAGPAGSGDNVQVDTGDGSIKVIDPSSPVVFQEGEAIQLEVDADDTVTVSVEDATSSNKGVAKFNVANFAVSSGDVTIKAGGVDIETELIGTAQRMYFTTVAGAQQALTLGAANTFLGGNGTSSAPSFQALADADIPDHTGDVTGGTALDITESVLEDGGSDELAITAGMMNTGTNASASTFWRGDNTWVTPAGGSGAFDDIDGAEDTARYVAPNGDTALVIHSDNSGNTQITVGNESDNTATTLSIILDSLIIEGVTFDGLQGLFMTVASNVLTFDSAAALEWIMDEIGEMIGGSSVQTGITVTDDDANDELDFVVSVDSQQVINSGLSEEDLDVTNAGSNGQVLSKAGNRFTWIADATGSGPWAVGGVSAGLDSTAVQVDADDDTLLIVRDDDAGAVEIIIGADQTSLTIGGPGLTLSDSLELTRIKADSLELEGVIYDGLQGNNLTATSNVLAVSVLDTTTTTVNHTQWDEFIKDQVGDMVTGNTETNITVTYQESDNTLDFVVSGGSARWLDKGNADSVVLIGVSDTLAQFRDSVTFTTIQTENPSGFMFLDGVHVEGNITTSGLIDGVDLADFAIDVAADSASWNAAADDFDTNYVQITLASVLGAVDLGAATSFELPNVNNPTTDAVGEVAFDANDFAIEGYDGTNSFLMAQKPKYIEFSADDPDNLINDTIVLLNVRAEKFPFGIEITDWGILTIESSTYSVNLEHWTDPNTAAGTETNVDAAVATSTSFEAEDDGSLTSPSVAAGSLVVALLPDTDVDQITVWMVFFINDGN